jgi:hypothetical protein
MLGRAWRVLGSSSALLLDPDAAGDQKCRVAWGALLLAVAAFLCTGLGVLFTPIPGVGAAFAFGAPVLAVIGVVLGGRAVTANKQRGETGGVAQAAVIASGLAFVPAMITALTCGACNALCATGQIKPGTFQTGFPSGTFDPRLTPGGTGSGAPVPAWPSTGPQATPDAGSAADDAPVVLPPPPLAPGPKGP